MSQTQNPGNPGFLLGIVPRAAAPARAVLGWDGAGPALAVVVPCPALAVAVRCPVLAAPCPALAAAVEWPFRRIRCR